MAHGNLGLALSGANQLDEAIAEYRLALQLNNDAPLIYFRLASAFRAKGDFRSALDAVLRGHELGLKDPYWRVRSGTWVRDHERFVELDDKLPAILENKLRPASAAEAIELAEICTTKQLHAGAARLYADAFAAQPALADRHRYQAACAAALAGSGKGKDASKLDDAKRATLRADALRWLREEFAKIPPAALPQQLQRWLRDPHLAGVRDAAALGQLPAAEQDDWRQLWDDIRAIVQASPQTRPQ